MQAATSTSSKRPLSMASATGIPARRSCTGLAIGGQSADPYNDYEPVDASASAIAAQGLLRLGHLLGNETYTQAGLTVAARLLQEPYLSIQPDHEGLLLQSIYHHPNGWDYIPPGAKVPCGESSMWGDYHLLELCLLIKLQ